MSTPRPWIVTRHDALIEHEPNLWSVAGDIPRMKVMNRRMIIAKLRDERLVFFNAIPLDDASMGKVTAWGKPWLLIVPHAAHMLDAHAFSARLKLVTACPAVELPAVRRRVPEVVALSTLTFDESLTVGTFEGSKKHEPWLVSRHGGRATLVVSDVLMNITAGPWVMRVLGFTGGVKVTPFQRWLFTRDLASIKEALKGLSQLEGLCRLIPSHGDVSEHDVASTLARIAEQL